MEFDSLDSGEDAGHNTCGIGSVNTSEIIVWQVHYTL